MDVWYFIMHSDKFRFKAFQFMEVCLKKKLNMKFLLLLSILI